MRELKIIQKTLKLLV